jgi:hypothetical protein
MNEPLNTTVGDRNLCAWQPVTGVCWVQTRVASIAEKLRRRSDSRLVVTGVSGGYLRTFEFDGKTLGWAKRLIARYTSGETITNETMEDKA